MTSRQDALQEILSIAQVHNLTATDIVHAMSDKQEAALQESSGILSRLFGYVGGILIFAGICVFIGQFWSDFNGATQILVSLGTGFCAYLLALAACDHDKLDRAATPLFLIAALFQSAGILVMLDVMSRGGDPLHGALFMTAVMTLQQGLTFWVKRRTTLAFTTTFFGLGFYVTLMAIWEIDSQLTALCLGASLMCVSWAMSQSPHRAISAFWYFFGSLLTLAAYADMVEKTPVEPTFLGLCAFFIFLSTKARSRTLLLVGTLAMLCYIGYFTGKHFNDSSEWPIVLILIGMAFFGLGALALRLNAKYIRGQSAA